MRRIMENTGVALLVLSFVFAGCGSSTGTKEQPVASKEVQLEDTKGIKVDIVNEKYEGDCHILGDTVMSCKKHDKTVYYQWKNNSYQECASEVFSKVITEEGNQHKIRFSYFIGKDRIYIADKTCSQQYDEVYGMQDNTKEVLLVLFTGDEGHYYFLDVDTGAMREVIASSQIKGEILSNETKVSEDGLYALVSTEEDYYLADLSHNTCVSFTELVGAEIIGCHFVGKHNVEFSKMSENSSDEELISRYCWNVDKGTVNTIIENSNEENEEVLSDNYMIYYGKEGTQIISFALQKAVVCDVAYKEDYAATFVATEDGTKLALMYYEETDDGSYIKDMYIIDFDTETSKKVTKVDEEMAFSWHMHGGWISDNTLVLASLSGVEIYKFT